MWLPSDPDRYIHAIYMLMRDAEGRKKKASKVKQTNKATQHSTPKAVTFQRIASSGT